jgi:hypothetical protein
MIGKKVDRIGRRLIQPNMTGDKPNNVKREASDISGTRRWGIWKIKLTNLKQ